MGGKSRRQVGDNCCSCESSVQPPKPDCSAVLCARPECDDAANLYTPEGECCPMCRDTKKTMVDCAAPRCEDGFEVYTPANSCCPACREQIISEPSDDSASVALTATTLSFIVTFLALFF